MIKTMERTILNVNETMNLHVQVKAKNELRDIDNRYDQIKTLVPNLPAFNDDIFLFNKTISLIKYQ